MYFNKQCFTPLSSLQLASETSVHRLKFTCDLPFSQKILITQKIFFPFSGRLRWFICDHLSPKSRKFFEKFNSFLKKIHLYQSFSNILLEIATAPLFHFFRDSNKDVPLIFSRKAE